MKYYKISGPAVLHSTGTKYDISKLQPGFDKDECDPLDAPECIPAGGMRRNEWNSLEEPIRYWFDAQIIILRSYM